MTDDETRKQEHQERIFEKELLPQVEALLSFAHQLTNSMEKANDLVQETFLQAYRTMDEYVEGSDAKTWLEKILKNIHLSQQS